MFVELSHQAQVTAAHAHRIGAAAGAAWGNAQPGGFAALSAFGGANGGAGVGGGGFGGGGGGGGGGGVGPQMARGRPALWVEGAGRCCSTRPRDGFQSPQPSVASTALRRSCRGGSRRAGPSQATAGAAQAPGARLQQAPAAEHAAAPQAQQIRANVRARSCRRSCRLRRRNQHAAARGTRRRFGAAASSPGAACGGSALVALDAERAGPALPSSDKGDVQRPIRRGALGAHGVAPDDGRQSEAAAVVGVPPRRVPSRKSFCFRCHLLDRWGAMPHSGLSPQDVPDAARMRERRDAEAAGLHGGIGQPGSVSGHTACFCFLAR